MYLWGALLLFVMLALSVPSILITIDTARQMINPGIEAWFNSQQLLMLGNIFSMIMVFIRFAAGIFANRLYKSHTMNMIQKIQDKNLDHDTYVSQLTKQGSVSTKLIMIFVGIYFISMFLFSFLLITIGF